MDAGGSALKLNFEIMAVPIVTAHKFTKGVLQQAQLKPDKHSILFEFSFLFTKSALAAGGLILADVVRTQ